MTTAPNATPLADLSKAARDLLQVVIGECRNYMSGGPSYYAIESIQRAAETFKARLEEIEAAAKAAVTNSDAEPRAADPSRECRDSAARAPNTAGGRS